MKIKPEKVQSNADCRTANLPSWLRQDADGSFSVLVHAQPGAKRDRVAGDFNGRLKIALAAPPVDGKANAHLLKFLAKLLGVPKSAIALVSGETMRDKRLRIDSVSAGDLIEKLAAQP